MANLVRTRMAMSCYAGGILPWRQSIMQYRGWPASLIIFISYGTHFTTILFFFNSLFIDTKLATSLFKNPFSSTLPRMTIV